jgi:hypothetical protein
MAARWTRGVDRGDFILSRGLTWCQSYQSTGDIYREALDHLRAGISSSQRLSHPFVRDLWRDILDLSQTVQRRGASVRVEVPEGYTPALLRA